jgi:uncharacterized membrane protein YfcA
MLRELIVFLVGIMVGGMNAIAGGGMLLGFPVLLAVGLPPLMANVTSNIVVLPGSLSSAYGYRNYLRKLNRRCLLLLAPCVIGATIGALILRNTSSSQFQRLVPGLVLFAIILFAFQPFLHHHLHRHLSSHRKALRPLLLIALALLPVAIYGGYFGAGFGFIILAFLGFTKLHEIHQMTGLKNLASVTVSAISIICLYSTHLINWHYGLAMAAGSLIGGYFGALLTQKIPSHAIRIIVIAIGLTTATYLALRSY